MITGLNFGASAGAVVKNDVNLLGDGELMFYDGLIPCDSSVDSITVDGQTDEDGIVSVTFTYSGSPYQVKYQIDGAGMWFIALVGPTIDIPGLALGDHTIEMIPVCLNGYEGEGLSKDFEVTQNLTCAITTTSITINDDNTIAAIVFSATPGTYKYRIDSGTWFTVPGTSTNLPIGTTPPGDHTLEVVPICSNGISGTGTTQNFTVDSRPTTTTIAYSLSNFPYSGNYLQIYVNGILRQNLTATGSGSFIVNVGDSVRADLNSPEPTHARAMTLQVTDTTTSTVIFTHSASSPNTFGYTFTVGNDNYSIVGTISA
jgi:hypothetical protein